MMDRDRELHEMADEGRALMSDYIKRVDALDIVAYNNVHGEITLNRYDKIIDGIYAIPSADVAPVRHGHWIKHEGFKKGVKDSIECSACGVWIDDMPRKTFCPNCGSIMYRYGGNDE